MSEVHPEEHRLQIIAGGRTLFDAVVSEYHVTTFMPERSGGLVRVELTAAADS